MENYESRFELRSGKPVYIPTAECRSFGAGVVSTIRERWQPPRWFYHLAKGGHVAALQEHSKNSVFGQLDIEDFFYSVSKSKIIRALVKTRFSFPEANEIATISTVRVGDGFALPYGFVQSPILASLVLSKSALGKSIARLDRSGVTRTVYVDDIVLSHATDEGVLVAAMDDVEVGARDAGFSINSSKLQGPATTITTFNIELGNNQLSLTDDRMDEFRSAIIGNTSAASVEAILAYVGGFNPDQAKILNSEIS